MLGLERKQEISLSLFSRISKQLQKKRGGSALHYTTLDTTHLKLYGLSFYVQLAFSEYSTFKEAVYVIGCLWCDYITGFTAIIKYYVAQGNILLTIN